MENKNAKAETVKENTGMDFYPLRNGQLIPFYVSKGGVWARIKSAYSAVDAVIMVVLAVFEMVFLALMIVMFVRGI